MMDWKAKETIKEWVRKLAGCVCIAVFLGSVGGMFASLVALKGMVVLYVIGGVLLITLSLFVGIILLDS